VADGASRRVTDDRNLWQNPHRTHEILGSAEIVRRRDDDDRAAEMSPAKGRHRECNEVGEVVVPGAIPDPAVTREPLLVREAPGHSSRRFVAAAAVVADVDDE